MEELYTVVVIENGYPKICFQGSVPFLGSKEYAEDLVAQFRIWFPGREYHLFELVKEA